MRRRHSTALRVEPLEGRDAPAALVGHNKVIYQDVDGDTVTVTLSKPVLTSDAVAGDVFTFNSAFATPGRQQLRAINLFTLGAAAATGVGVTLTAIRGPTGGDGFANVGQIDASSIDLGPVTIDGDLGRVVAGDATASTSGLKGLKVRSMGRYGTSTGAPNLNSVVQGKLDLLKVKGDIKDAFVDVLGDTDGKVGLVFVGGSLIGGTAGGSGAIRSAGTMGRVTVRGNLVGGAGDLSGAVFSNGNLAGMTVGGSVTGGAGQYSGLIHSFGDVGPVKIAGNLSGGSNNYSGVLNANGKLISAKVGGSVIGGPGFSSGGIFAVGGAGSIVIGGDLIGGSATGSAQLADSGYIQVGHIRNLTLGGSLIAGVNNTSGFFRDNGAIRASDDLGTVLIKGGIIGNSTNPAIITARGQAHPTATSDIAIGKLTVNGRVEYAQILAGIDRFGDAVNADAQIGAVAVGGDWVASSLAAGAVPGPAGYGSGDAKMAGLGVKDDSLVFSRIASLTIGGQALGTVGGIDFYGIVAQNVGAVKVGGTAIPLAATRSTDNFFVGVTLDFKVHEI